MVRCACAAVDYVVSSALRQDSALRSMRSLRNADPVLMSRWNSRGTRTRRATTGSFVYVPMSLPHHLPDTQAPPRARRVARCSSTTRAACHDQSDAI